MDLSPQPEWTRLALYAAGAAAVLIALFSIPRIGPVFRGLFSAAMLALLLFVLAQQAAFVPGLSWLADGLGGGQEVSGDEVRIRMAPDGHFWARVQVNGVERRMLIDSGATVTALSEETADLAGIERDPAIAPVVLRTANGVVRARTGEVERLAFGGLEARNLKVVISPGLGGFDVLGMNFLSELGSWRVEGRTLVLTPG